MRAFIALTVTILLHLGCSIIYSFPLNDANLETQWDNISIQDLQLSFSSKNDDTMKTISILTKRYANALRHYNLVSKLIIETSYKSSQLPTKDIDLGTKNLWALEDQVIPSYIKLYLTLNCQLKSICKFQFNGVQIQSALTLSTPIQTNDNTTRAYLGIPIDIIVRKSPSGTINTIFNYKQWHVYPESEAKNLQIDDHKLNSIVIPLKPKIIETFENMVSSFSIEYHDIKTSDNSSEIASNFQQTHLYIIPDPKVINMTDNIHQLPQCTVENVKKDIGEITNSNFIVITEGLSNFPSAEMEGNYTVFYNKQLKIELKTENPLRGKLLWEFSSKQNSNNYSVKVDFTIDHLCIKTEMQNAFYFHSAEFGLQVKVDVGKLKFKTSVIDVIENEEKFSQCISSIIAKSVSNSSKQAIKSQLLV